MKKTFFAAALVVLAAAVACSDKAPSPAAPTVTPVAVDDSNAAADGSTLKVTAPGQVSPANGTILSEFDVTLRISASTPKFSTTPIQLAYRFELIRNGSVVESARDTSLLAWKPKSALESNAQYSWRARAEQGTLVGPWSATWTFTTPDQPPGYIVPGEVYDPLFDGKTVGNANGSVTFLPGIGARLNGHTSHIEYVLPSTIVSGQISALVTNVATNTEGGKTKIMAMREGRSDLTTNDRRFTIEKRGDPPGIVAWRVITSNDQIDTVGRERVERNFSTSKWYLWTARWGNNRFDLTIDEDGAGGKRIYSFGKHYKGTYDPNPHLAYLGAPLGRAGADDATVPGMVVKQLWISSRPRPPFANK
jgi:hypothetical protein